MKNSNCLVTLIIGDENSNYDGKIISRSYNNNHLVTIFKIKSILSNIGYDLDFKNNNELNDIIFNLILKGHIVFLNISNNTLDKFGLLYLPLYMTEKQLATFEKFNTELDNFDLIKFSIDKNSMKLFETINDNTKNKKYTKN